MATNKDGREYRAAAGPFDASGEGGHVSGYAATFDNPYQIAEFEGIKYYEKLSARAFDGADMTDVVMRYDHEGRVYARTGNGSLALSVDGHGLAVDADLTRTDGAKQLRQEIAAGMITKMSWAFTVGASEYDRDSHTVTITRVKKVYDVSAVTYPANPGTEISARSYLDGVIETERRESLARRRRIMLLRMRMEETNQ